MLNSINTPSLFLVGTGNLQGTGQEFSPDFLGKELLFPVTFGVGDPLSDTISIALTPNSNPRPQDSYFWPA